MQKWEYLVINLHKSLATGLTLMANPEDDPFLPKLTQVAKGNLAIAVGLMVVTIIYMPLIMPLLLQSLEVNPWDIAQSLILIMLVPLTIGLFIKAR